MKRIFLKNNFPEIAIFLLIISYSFIIRVYKLSSLPPVINGDEVGSILHPLQIILGKSGSIFNLTHDLSVSYVIYLAKALSLSIFGVDNAIFAVRLTTAIASTLLLIPFYLIIKNYVNKYIALLMTFAFSSNYWFINFSRLSWIAVDSLFPGLLLFFLTDKILDKPSRKYYVFLGITSAAVLSGYMGGRIFVIASYIVLIIHAFKKTYSLNNPEFKNIAVSAVVALAIFAPQLTVVLKNPSRYLLRPSSVYVFDLKGPYYNIDPKNKIGIISHQAIYATKGFLFFDSSISSEGFENARLVPPGHAGVNSIIVIFFWIGIISYLFKKRGSSTWFVVYLLNIFLLQIPSVYIPSWSRAIAIIPIIYFFATVGLQSTLNFAKRFNTAQFYLATSAIVAFLIIFSIFDVGIYWNWVQSDVFRRAQQPAVDVRQYNEWVTEQITRVKTGQREIFNSEWNTLHPLQ